MSIPCLLPASGGKEVGDDSSVCVEYEDIRSGPAEENEDDPDYQEGV